MLRFGTIAFITALLIVLAPDSPRASDTTRFRVDSYRPTKFIDFGWRLDGGANLSSNSKDQSGLFPETQDPAPIYESRVTEDDSHQATLWSRWQFRYETLSRFFDAELDFGSSYNNRSSSDSRRGYSILTDEIRLWDESSTANFRTETSFAADLRQFLVADLSLSGFLTVTHMYLDVDQEQSETMETEVYLPELNADLFRQIIDHTDGRSVMKDLDLSGEILLGWGRVYEGQYAATVLFFVEELYRRGLLPAEPSRADLLDLTAMVHSYRLRHVIDSREHRAEALADVMALMRERGLIESEDAATLFALEDVWDYYYPAVERKFGWSARFGFGGRDDYESLHSHRNDDIYRFAVERYRDSVDVVDTLEHSFSQSTRGVNDSDFNPSDFLVLRLEYFNPLGTHWQLNTSAIIRSYIRKKIREPEKEGEIKLAREGWREIAGKLKLSYLHDARTTVALFSEVAGDQVTTTYYPLPANVDQTPKVVETSHWLLVAGVTVDYRLARPTTLFVEWSHVRQYNKADRGSGIDRVTSHGFDLSVGITHWLF